MLDVWLPANNNITRTNKKGIDGYLILFNMPSCHITNMNCKKIRKIILRSAVAKYNSIAQKTQHTAKNNKLNANL